jgi:hypothetical protein
MPDEPNQPPPGEGGAQGPPFSEQIQHAPVGARVPDRVAPGVFATGVIVFEGPEEFVLDFVQGVTRPPRIGARVVLSHRVMSQFVNALRDNLHRYEQTFGPPKPVPPPSTQRRPSIQEMYQDLRLPDELLSGTYATTVMIGHSPSEFFMEFITRFFPTAAVSARVYVSASQMPQMLQAVAGAWQNHLNRPREPRQPPPPAEPT